MGADGSSRKLSARNYFEVISSFLFFILGLIIFYRSLFETRLALGMVVGAVFLGFGIFRLRYVWNYFFRKGEGS